MAIRDLMTSNPATLEPSSTVADAAKVMASEDVGPVPIVEGERLVGMVTDRDLVVRVIAEGRDPNSTTLGEIASSDLVTIQPDTELEEATRLMSQHQVRRLLVTEDGGRLIGIVAQADIARALDEERTGAVVQDVSQ